MKKASAVTEITIIVIKTIKINLILIGKVRKYLTVQCMDPVKIFIVITYPFLIVAY